MFYYSICTRECLVGVWQLLHLQNSNRRRKEKIAKFCKKGDNIKEFIFQKIMHSCSKTHYKFSICDILGSSIDRESGHLCCQVRSNDEVSKIIYQNVRIAGLVIEKKDTTPLSYFVDDGSGIIKVIYDGKDSDESELPKVSEYIEFLGEVIPESPPFIRVECFSVKSDPMEEVRHILEQAAIHKDFFSFQFLADDSLISSQPSEMSGIEKLAESTLEFIQKNPNGVKFDDIAEFCQSSDTAKEVIDSLMKETLIYEDDSLFYSV